MNKKEMLTDLFNSQKLAGLATQSGGQPHNCLVAFAATDELRSLLFATRRDTQKFRDISANPPVSILIDNRGNSEADFEQAVAVTVKGIAGEIGGPQRDSLAEHYLSKHPYLGNFVRNPNVALIRVEVSEYLVASFDATEVIKPG